MHFIAYLNWNKAGGRGVGVLFARILLRSRYCSVHWAMQVSPNQTKPLNNVSFVLMEEHKLRVLENTRGPQT